MKLHSLWILPTAAVLAACAAGSPRMNERDTRERYLDYAGAPINSFTHLGGFDGWRPLGRDKLVVWTGINTAYLLTVESSCLGLDFAERIAVDSTPGASVHSGFDYIRFHDGVRRERCRITEIRPVDYKQMRTDMKAAKE